MKEIRLIDAIRLYNRGIAVVCADGEVVRTEVENGKGKIQEVSRRSGEGNVTTISAANKGGFDDAVSRLYWAIRGTFVSERRW